MPPHKANISVKIITFFKSINYFLYFNINNIADIITVKNKNPEISINVKLDFSNLNLVELSSGSSSFVLFSLKLIS